MDRLGGLDDSSLALLFAAALTAFLCGLALLRQSRRRAERRASERTMLAREAHLFRQTQQAVSMKRAITAITEALNDDARLPAMLQWLGRHSLAVYMVHQPLLFGALWIAVGGVARYNG